MQTVNFKTLSGISKLFLDFIDGSETAIKYYNYNFKNANSFLDASRTVDKAAYDRERLAEIISKSTSGLHNNIKSNIEKLARPDSLVVFSGQQVGIYLGPMYTVIKALTSYKLASKLESILKRPVVPCFWMATDDHDFDEIKTVNLLDRSGACHQLAYDPSSVNGDTPMADIVLDGEINNFRTSVSDNLIETEFTSSINDILNDRYSSGNSLSSSFAGLFADFLGEFGIIPVDPNYPGMKRMFAPVFRQEIEDYSRIFELFESASQKIIDDGYHRQVHKSGESLNLFFNENGRANILHEDSTFHLDGKDITFSKKDILEKLESEPEKFSPNVCLRPVAQCYAFPTICQVVGPSEAAYFAQIKPIFDFMNIPWPVIQPRMFATIIEPHIRKTIDKLNIDFSSLYNDTNGEISRVIKENFPSEIQANSDSIRNSIEKPLRDLSKSLKNTDPESYQALEHSRKQIDHELNHLFKKLSAAHRKRHDTAIGQIRRTADFMFPQGKFQERVISPVYFANKFGIDIFKKLEEKLDIESVDHQLVDL